MNDWEKYRKNKRKVPSRTRELWLVKNKLKKMHKKDHFSKKIHSSISLPNFIIFRLRKARQKVSLSSKKSAKKLSESQVVLACLVCLLKKLNNRQQRVKSNTGPRRRLYNDEVYSYGKISIYTSRELCQAFHGRAIELEVSLSLLADLAIRLYLNHILSLWSKDKKPFNKLDNLLSFSSYQKTIVNHYAKRKGETAKFLLQLKFCFGDDGDISPMALLT